MRETEKFRTERLAVRPWQIEDLPLAMELWGDPAVTALIDSRGKLTNAQVGEKLRAEIERERSGGVLRDRKFILSVQSDSRISGRDRRAPSRSVLLSSRGATRHAPICRYCLRNGLLFRGDRWFESGSLQRRVMSEPWPRVPETLIWTSRARYSASDRHNRAQGVVSHG
jgi:hypothetical protein